MEQPAIETFAHAGLTVEIHHDEEADHANPRDHNNLGVMLCGHRDYTLGDEQIARDDEEFEIVCRLCDGTGEGERMVLWRNENYGWVRVGSGSEASMRHEYKRADERGTKPYSVEPEKCVRCEGEGRHRVSPYEWLTIERGATVILPLFLLDHSGLSIRAGENRGSSAPRGRFIGDEAGWDTSMVGWIFDTAETRSETGCEGAGFGPDMVERNLRGEVEEYDLYLRGDVRFFVVRGPDGTTLDSCHGFLGGDYIVEEAKSTAEGCAKDIERERQEVAHWAARDVPTVAP